MFLGESNSIVLASGLLLAAVLLAFGALIGARYTRRRTPTSEDPMSQGDRERVLELLQELESWTNEYSGNVNEYQVKLDELAKAVGASAGNSQAENRVVILLQQIMSNNDQLKTRLDAAERQLEKQTRQIESYLTEARTDGLTGLYNRRAFDQKLEELFVGYRNGGRSFVVVLIDIDKFKLINDTHGHQAGDAVLKQLAQTLRSVLDQTIMVARFGGEEFAVIMDGPLRIAAERLNEVRKLVEKTPMNAGETEISVTISVGLSEPRDDLVVGPVLRRSDEALYMAKNIGRNRVYFDEGKGPRLVGAPEVAKRS
jgi:diguanylate cyclase